MESLAIPFQLIADALNNIKTYLGGIVDNFRVSVEDKLHLLNYINPFHENFFLRIALVPNENYFSNKWSQLHDLFNNKFPLASQLFDFFNNLKNVSQNGGIPEFKVDLPSKYGGMSVDIIDFTPFVEYRVLVLNFIRFIAWYFFLKRIYTRLPHFIYN